MTKKKTKYYDWQKTLSYDSPITMVVGARGVGKTFGIRLQCVKDWLKDGSRFVEVSRFKAEQGEIAKGYFDRLQPFFPDLLFKVEGTRGYVAKKPESEDDQPEWDVICYYVAMTELQKSKRSTYEKVRRIIMDEAIIEHSDRYHRYLPGEWNILANLVDSVSRERPESEVHPRVYLLGNAVDLVNPYFEEMGIFSPPTRGYSWHLNKLCLLHYVDDAEYGQAKQSKTVAGRMLAGTEAGNSAAFSDFSREFEGSIAKKPSSARFQFAIRWQKHAWGLWLEESEGRYYVSSKVPKNAKAIALSIGEVAPNRPMIERTAPTMRAILGLARMDGLRFESLGQRAAFFEACGMLGWT